MGRGEKVNLETTTTGVPVVRKRRGKKGKERSGCGVSQSLGFISFPFYNKNGKGRILSFESPSFLCRLSNGREMEGSHWMNSTQNGLFPLSREKINEIGKRGKVPSIPETLPLTALPNQNQRIPPHLSNLNPVWMME